MYIAQMKKVSFLTFALIFIPFWGYSQGQSMLNITLTSPSSLQETDTIVVETIEPDSLELNKIPTIISVFEKQNKRYSTPKGLPERVIALLKKDVLEISPEAMYWINWQRDPSTIIGNNVSLRDITIINHIFLTPVFHGNIFKDEDLIFYSMDFTKSAFSTPPLYTAAPLFEKYTSARKFEDIAIKHLEHNHPLAFRFSKDEMPQELIQTRTIKRSIHEDLSLRMESDLDFSDVEAPIRFIPERRYWLSSFESTVQFAQNHISENWHSGGSSNLNIFTKNTLKYNYKKEKLSLTNELEFRTSVYTASKDAMRRYRVGDDILRIYSNLGFVAFNKWSYTIDGEIKTQVITNYQENSNRKQAAFLAPLKMNFGVGMKYNLDKTIKRHKNIKLAVNLAPLSFTYMYSTITDDIDLGRHGFKRDEKHKDTEIFKNSLTQIGSTIRTDLTFNINRTTSWQSRLYYFTTYEKVVAEVENTLAFHISRFFETRIYLHLRFDDGVTKVNPNNSYLQVNELLSFGFKYKW
jgi:Protein of unknown function (DUF3078).